MRVFAILLALLAVGGIDRAARAQQSNDCKVCGDQLRACLKNHSRTACTTEHDICMKHCRRPGSGTR